MFKIIGGVLISLFVGQGSFASEGFEGETELGMVATGGNTDTEVLSFRSLNSYVFKNNTLRVGMGFTRGTDSEQENAKRWDARVVYQRRLDHRRQLLIQQNVESDKFSGFAHRYNSDVGIKWQLAQRKNRESSLEVGYRYTLEQNIDRTLENEGERDEHKLRLYYFINAEIQEGIKARFWIEALPNFTEPEDWIVSFEPSVSFRLTKGLSLRQSFLGIYDNQVNIAGNRKFDYTMTTSLTVEI